MRGNNTWTIAPAVIAVITTLLVHSFGTLHAASAASLFFSLSSSTTKPGSTITVSVRVSSADQAMNAASGVVVFPTDKLEVVSVSKTGSIFSLWAEEPVVSKTAGTISFEGIILNPGFNGTAGRLLTITFKAKAAGAADIRFNSGSVLANDGEGTKLATTLGSARITIDQTQPIATQPEKTPATTNDVPDAPTVASSTHPDPTKSYNNAIARFHWPLPADATAMRILYSKNRDSTPTVVYQPPIQEKQLETLPDGTYFFHAQMKNSNGWSTTTHFRFQIDTTAPTGLTIERIDTEHSNTVARFRATAADSLSGIDRFEMSVDDERAVIAHDTPAHFETPVLASGEHTLSVRVFDKAGNSDTKTIAFSITEPTDVPPDETAASTDTETTAPVATTTQPRSGLLDTVWMIFMVLSALAVIYGLYETNRTRTRLRKEIAAARLGVNTELVLLKSAADKHVKLLEKAATKRELTLEEEKILGQLKRAVKPTKTSASHKTTKKTPHP